MQINVTCMELIVADVAESQCLTKHFGYLETFPCVFYFFFFEKMILKFSVAFVCCPLVFEFSVGTGGFVIGLGQIVFFFSLFIS